MDKCCFPLLARMVCAAKPERSCICTNWFAPIEYAAKCSRSSTNEQCKSNLLDEDDHSRLGELVLNFCAFGQHDQVDLHFQVLLDGLHEIFHQRNIIKEQSALVVVCDRVNLSR